jgi:hypothetical protein
METIDLATLAPPDIPVGEAPQEGQQATPEPETEETSQATEGQEQEGQEGQEAEGGEPQEQQRPADLNKRVSDFLKAMKDPDGKNADVLKAIRNAYFGHNAYSELGKVDDIRALKQQLDSLGGFEAISQLQEIASSVENTDALLDAGDPEVLDQIFEDSKEGAIKLAPHYLNRIAKESPEAYQRAVLPHFVQSLEAANFPRVMDALFRATADKPEAQEIVKDIVQWFSDQKRLADGFKTDSLSPERNTIKSEREELAQERERIFMEGIQQDIVSKINGSLSSRLKEYEPALRGMSERARRDFASALYQEIQKLADADTGYKNTLSAMIASKRRDRNGVVNFIGSKVDSVADRIVSAVAKDYGLKKGGATQKANGAVARNGSGKSSPASPAKVAGKPNVNDVDWDKTSNVDFLTKRAWLKNGNFVQW